MTSLLQLPVRLKARLMAFLALFLTPSAAMAQQATNQGGDPITSALLWMQSILLGPIATALAVMAVAGVGFMMLTGRMNWRYGMTVIIGVFIIFGAPRLVATIAGGAGV
ncbi:TrbC/VirB2 family protein [Erythrobacter longus]|nr:TrbC/VirB2 family protein [Erythrobacter longus]